MTGNGAQGITASFLSLLDGLDLGVLVVDGDGLVRHADDSAAATLGLTGPTYTDVRLEELAEQSEGALLREVLDHVLKGSPWRGELRLGLGIHRHVRTTWAPLNGGDPLAVALLEPVEDESERTDLSEQLRRLAVVSTELLAATSVDGVMTVMTEHLAQAVGATIASVSLQQDDETFALASIYGGRPTTSIEWATYPIDRNTPIGTSYLDGRPLVLVGRDEINRRFPDLDLLTEGERSMVCLPLGVADRKLGAVGLSFPGLREPTASELEYLTTLCDTCALALERISAQEEASAREAKLRFLAEASVTLSSSLDWQATLAAVAHLAVPEYADWCVIHLLQDGELRPIAMAHPDTIQESRVRDLQERYPPDPKSPYGVHEVARTGRSILLPDIPDELLEMAAHDEEHLQILRELDFRSALEVPLKIHDRVLGVITWVTGSAGRRFTQEDLEFGEHMARRAALAIDNAHLHTEIRDVALRLQRTVLPTQTPRAPGWDVAVNYLPAGRSEIGGDFYDVAPLEDGRVAAFVGDVMGRGVAAASAMAQMRSALRTLVALDPEPTVVMAGLDRLFERFDLEQLVTVAYAVLDPGRGTVEIVNAGHPAPLLVRADGTTEHVVNDETLILGVGGGQRSVAVVGFGPGDTLLMFTDGLVERRDESLDEGQRRLVDSSELVRAEDLQTGLTRLVTEVRDETRDDDVAALALRLRSMAVDGVA